MSRLPLADMAAIASASAAGISWIENVNGILQMGATTVAIIAGVYAIRWHRVRIKQATETRNDDKSK